MKCNKTPSYGKSTDIRIMYETAYTFLPTQRLYTLVGYSTMTITSALSREPLLLF